MIVPVFGKGMKVAIGLMALWVAFVAPCNAGEQKGTEVRAGERSPRLHEGEFFSASLQKKAKYRVLLPTKYSPDGKRFPVLFLLHGLYGDYTNWSKLTKLVAYSEDLDLVIAMPGVGDSWYVNSPSDPTARYEDFVVRDFIAEIDGKYRTIADREHRFIAGLSMGGYAAVYMSEKYPQLFSYAGGFSAALDAPLNLDERRTEFGPSLVTAFGPHGSQVRQDNDVFRLLEAADGKKVVPIYLDCGEEDMFLDVNRRLAAKLQAMKAAYQYREYPGDHNWEYWDGAIIRFLNVLLTKGLISGKLRCY
jgi:putative tributyrin esterase